MADEKAGKRVTILNQKEGKLVLPPDADELKKNSKAKERVVPSGHALEVSAEEAERLLKHRGIVDASKLVGPSGDAARVLELQKQLEDAKAENERLKKSSPKADKAEKAAAK